MANFESLMRGRCAWTWNLVLCLLTLEEWLWPRDSCGCCCIFLWTTDEKHAKPNQIHKRQHYHEKDEVGYNIYLIGRNRPYICYNSTCTETLAAVYHVTQGWLVQFQPWKTCWCGCDTMQLDLHPSQLRFVKMPFKVNSMALCHIVSIFLISTGQFREIPFMDSMSEMPQYSETSYRRFTTESGQIWFAQIGHDMIGRKACSPAISSCPDQVQTYLWFQPI